MTNLSWLHFEALQWTVNYGCTRPPLRGFAVSGTERTLGFGAQFLLFPLIPIRLFLVLPGGDMTDPENLLSRAQCPVEPSPGELQLWGELVLSQDNTNPNLQDQTWKRIGFSALKARTGLCRFPYLTDFSLLISKIFLILPSFSWRYPYICLPSHQRTHCTLQLLLRCLD